MKTRSTLGGGLLLLLLATVVVQSQTVGRTDLSASLLAAQFGWWRAVPGFTMSTRLYDLLGRIHCTVSTTMGTLGTSSGWSATTRPGGYMQLNFDGSDDYVDCGSDELVDDVRQRTIALWVFLTGYGTNNNIRLVDKRQAGTGWTFGVNNSAVSAGLGFIQDFNGGNGVGNWALSNVVPLQTWVHVGVTYDSLATVGTTPTFYVNGEPAGPDTTLSSPSGAYDSDAASVLVFGAEDLGLGKLLPGAMDDIRLWGRILSATEMRAVYELSLRGDPGLLRAPGALVSVTSAGPLGPPGSFFPFFR